VSRWAGQKTMDLDGIGMGAEPQERAKEGQGDRGENGQISGGLPYSGGAAMARGRSLIRLIKLI
jgi:hypothetical protein